MAKSINNFIKGNTGYLNILLTHKCGIHKDDSLSLKVEFAFDKAELAPDARAMLDGLGYALSSKELGTLRFLIEGHTDAVGSESYNQDLSERRAAAVKEYLVSMLGIFPDRLETIGYGETRLFDKENPQSGENLRVRILRID